MNDRGNVRRWSVTVAVAVLTTIVAFLLFRWNNGYWSWWTFVLVPLFVAVSWIVDRLDNRKKAR